MGDKNESCNDKRFAENLKQYVDNFLKSQFSKYFIDIISSQYLTTLDKDYELLFLDIDLEGLSGIDLGKKAISLDSNPLIIFVSSRNDLVFSSFSARPFYFVRKTNLQEDLSTMFVLLKKYFQDTMTFFTFEFYGRKTNIFLKDIYMIESQGHNIIIKTKNGDYNYRSTMNNILDMIKSESIIQIQKSYAVNIDYIKEINKGVILLKNGEKYNIGRKFKEAVMKSYKEYFLK